MSEEIDLGGISVDAGRLIKQLREDCRDDWFPDPLGYKDLLSEERLVKALQAHLEAGGGLFRPERRSVLNVPKKGFTLRYALDTSILDRAYYHALVADLVPRFDELLPGNVLSHRCAFGKYRGRYLFRRGVDQWKKFKSFVLHESGSRPVVLEADVQNYFENISIATLLETLRERVIDLDVSFSEKTRIHSVLGLLEPCLEEWCYQGHRGLPQNRDASSFLSNLYMLPVDLAMIEGGYSYYRYMDDIRVATSSRYEARAALRDLVTELRKRELNVNAAKTKIREPGMEGYEESLKPGDSRLEQIEEMFRSRSSRVVRRALGPLREVALEHLGSEDSQRRSFRFCINRFLKLAHCQDLDLPSDYFSPVVDKAIGELDSQPFASDQIVRFLKAAPTSLTQLARIASFLLDEEKAIYGWQNFLLWQLFVNKSFEQPKLLARARRSLGQESSAAERAGAMLYLGALGGTGDRELVVNCFESCKTNLEQRSALIAVHEVPYSEGSIEARVKPFVKPSLVGSYGDLRNHFRGQYHEPIEKQPFSELFDRDSPYE